VTVLVSSSVLRESIDLASKKEIELSSKVIANTFPASIKSIETTNLSK